MKIFNWVIYFLKKLGSRLRKKRQEDCISKRALESRSTTKSEIDRKIGQLIASTDPIEEAVLIKLIQEQTSLDLELSDGDAIGNSRFLKRGLDLVEVEQEINKLNRKLFEIGRKESQISPVNFPQSYPTNTSIEALERSFQEHDSKQNLMFSTSVIGKLKSRSGDFDKFLQERILVRIFRIREENRTQEEETKKQEVKELMGRIESLINHGDFQETQNQIVRAVSSISALRNSDQKKFFREKLETLKTKFRSRQIQEEANRQAEELKKRHDEAERRRIAEEAKREEERKQREQQELFQKQQEEARRSREEGKKQELKRLLTKKSNWQEFAEILKENGILKFYHFTDRTNISSIKDAGGLFSWHHCDNYNILIPKTGGDTLSRDLDKSHRLHDYVRLSFCNDHPMQFRLSQSGYNLVLLEVSIEVAFFENTRFSDINATDNSHRQGTSLEDLKRVKFSATKKSYVRKEDPDFKFHQAEIMVKTWIPIEYIMNINQF